MHIEMRASGAYGMQRIVLENAGNRTCIAEECVSRNKILHVDDVRKHEESREWKQDQAKRHDVADQSNRERKDERTHCCCLQTHSKDEYMVRVICPSIVTEACYRPLFTHKCTTRCGQLACPTPAPP